LVVSFAGGELASVVVLAEQPLECIQTVNPETLVEVPTLAAAGALFNHVVECKSIVSDSQPIGLIIIR
jgi:hypothetical protein